MGRPNACNCRCVIVDPPPCEGACWHPQFCAGDDSEFTESFLSKLEFVITFVANYSRKHQLILKSGDNVIVLGEVPIDEEKAGSRRVIFTTSLSTVTLLRSGALSCDDISLVGEKFEFDKSLIGINLFFIHREFINEFTFFDNDEDINVYIYDDSRGLIVNGGQNHTAFNSVFCGFCSSDQDFIDSFTPEELDRLYGVRYPQIDTVYCGFNRDGELYTAKRLESAQLNVNSQIGNIKLDSVTTEERGAEFLPCGIYTLTFRHAIDISIDGDFSGTYSAAPYIIGNNEWDIVDRPYQCQFPEWFVRMRALPVSATYTTTSHFGFGYDPLGRDCVCPGTSFYDIPYVGYALLYIANQDLGIGISSLKKLFPNIAFIKIFLYRQDGFLGAAFDDRCNGTSYEQASDLSPEQFVVNIEDIDNIQTARLPAGWPNNSSECLDIRWAFVGEPSIPRLPFEVRPVKYPPHLLSTYTGPPDRVINFDPAIGPDFSVASPPYAVSWYGCCPTENPANQEEMVVLDNNIQCSSPIYDQGGIGLPNAGSFSAECIAKISASTVFSTSGGR